MAADPRTRLSAYGLCLDASRRLLLARMAVGPDKGRWTLPGGGVDWGEHPDDALLRELKEETGAEGVTAGRVLAVYSRTYDRSVERPWAPFHHVGIVYEVEGVGEDLVHEQDGSTDRCEWFAREAVEQLPLVPLAEFGVNLAWPHDRSGELERPTGR
jgi:ADP-ribose pyrophosphatase YjhB (NUDIX family)